MFNTILIEPIRGEEWSTVVGYENLYRISSFGRLTSISKSAYGKPYPRKFEKILKPHLNETTGYFAYVFSSFGHGKDKQQRIHRLVANHFIPNPLNLPEVNHIDGNKTNNNILNLEWASRIQNIQHGFKTGLIKVLHGSETSNCILTDKQVMEIFNSIEGPRSLSRKLGLGYSTVNSIKNGVSWNHLTGLPKKVWRKKQL